MLGTKPSFQCSGGGSGAEIHPGVFALASLEDAVVLPNDELRISEASFRHRQSLRDVAAERSAGKTGPDRTEPICSFIESQAHNSPLLFARAHHSLVCLRFLLEKLSTPNLGPFNHLFPNDAKHSYPWGYFRILRLEKLGNIQGEIIFFEDGFVVLGVQLTSEFDDDNVTIF